MIRLSHVATIAGFAAFAAAAACAPTGGAGAPAAPASGTIDLMADGLAGFVEVGDADWTFENGEIKSDSGEATGFLLTPEDYADFELTVEFFVSAEHNSGVFFRCSDRATITDMNCYEANVFDNRPDQSGRTGGIPNYAPPIAVVDAAGQWNTYVIRAEGDHILITLNGVTTVDAQEGTFASGPIGFQRGAGTVIFRKIEVRPL